MTQEHPEQPGRVPVGELRELVEHWRQKAEKKTGDDWESVAIGQEWCAEELEAVIDKYE